MAGYEHLIPLLKSRITQSPIMLRNTLWDQVEATVLPKLHLCFAFPDSVLLSLLITSLLAISFPSISVGYWFQDLQQIPNLQMLKSLSEPAVSAGSTSTDSINHGWEAQFILSIIHGPWLVESANVESSNMEDWLCFLSKLLVQNSHLSLCLQEFQPKTLS